MIQRIQSLFLALVSLLSLLLFGGSFLTFTENSGSVIKVVFAGILRETAGQEGVLIQTVYPYSALVILIPLISLITIFMFRNRRLQTGFVLTLGILILLLLSLSVYYYMLIADTYGAPFKPGIIIVIPFLLLIFSVLAYRGIRKDDEIVKSYDRLR